MRSRLTTLLAALPLLLAAPVAGAADDARTEAGLKATDGFVALLDAGKYGESWGQAAALFKGAVPQERWVELAGAARKPLGKLLERKVQSRAYATTLPGGPDGEYVVVQYASSFAEKKAAVETVTAQREKDGAWRVAGYFVR